MPCTVKSSFTDLVLEESDTICRFTTNCSQLKYHMPFLESYELIVFPEGPCGSISVLSIHACPPGFMWAESDINCEYVRDISYLLLSIS